MVKTVMVRRLLTSLLLPLLLVPVALGAPDLALPDLGSGAIRLLAGTEEANIGRSIVNQLRRNNLVLEDPEITEYIQNLGARLVAAADKGETDFHFFVVKDDTINAFALPGGYIGVHSGLIVQTDTESELASVLAHEVAHVTQRHIARRFEAGSGMNLKSLAILLGAIALAAAGGGADDVAGSMMLGQGLALQQQINFTRAQEYEADRVGVEILAGAGFDPSGMVDFFETMQRIQRLQNSRMPEFLSTHPLSLSRVSEAAQRVRAMEDTQTVQESRGYPLMKARLRVLAGTAPMLTSTGDAEQEAAMRYGRALELMKDGEASTAAAMLAELVAENDSITHYHIAWGNALLESGNSERALAVLEQAARLFPENIPVGLAQANALRRSGKADAALELLRDLFNRNDPQPEYVRIMAGTAADAGATGESHYYMSEYYLRTGDPYSARIQLELAVKAATPASNKRLQYEARLEEVNEALLEMQRDRPRRDRGEPR